MKKFKLFNLIALAAIVLAACGGGATATTAPTTAPEVTAAPTLRNAN